MPPELPNSAVSKSSLVNGNKKGMGVSTSRLPLPSGLRIASM